MNGEIEYRVATVAGVSFPKREIALVVMPYESPTMVLHEGRPITEIVSRGAFDGIERRSNRVAVNRDHEITRTVGRAVTFHPSRDEGLVSDLRISQTALGDETLTLAADGVLDASAGFLPMQGGEVWERADLRRLTKIWLAHIALTPDPAYEDARVLAVRSEPPPPAPPRVVTPNLDILRGLMLEDRYTQGVPSVAN